MDGVGIWIEEGICLRILEFGYSRTLHSFCHIMTLHSLQDYGGRVNRKTRGVYPARR